MSNTQHDVRQTHKGQFEVSLSYLCPRHLWHRCVQLEHLSRAAGEHRVGELMLPQAENYMAATETKQHVCFSASKTEKQVYGDA